MPFSVSSLGTVGPYTVELATAVAGLDVELHSVYLGHPASDTHAVHLELRRDGPPRVTTREHPHASLPVTYAH